MVKYNMQAGKIIRLGLWLMAVLAGAAQNTPPLSLLIFAALLGMLLVLADENAAVALAGRVGNNKLAWTAIPLLLLLPGAALAAANGTLDWGELLIAGLMLYLPLAAAAQNTPNFAKEQTLTGLVIVAMPLLLPLARRGAFAMQDGWLRVGAFALPALLLLFANRQQKQRLHFLFVCAALSFWYAVQFNALPDLPLLSGALTISYFTLVVAVLLLLAMILSGQAGKVRVSFTPGARGIGVVANNIALAIILLLPVGLATGAFVPLAADLALPDSAIRLMGLFLLVALPQEILFRGALHSYFADDLHLGFNPSLLLSSLLFGAAHLGMGLVSPWYVALALIAGVLYARAFVFTRNIASAALVHAAVNWAGAVFFLIR